MKSAATLKFSFALLALAHIHVSGLAADYPEPQQADYVLGGFRFRSGETLPELRLHYRTLGAPRASTQGTITNTVLILHGTTRSGNQFIRPEFAGELFGQEQSLDAARYYLIFPDGIGHGVATVPTRWRRFGSSIWWNSWLSPTGRGLAHSTGPKCYLR